MSRPFVRVLALAVLLPTLMLVVDFVEWSRWRQDLQRLLDRSAVAQAEHLRVGRPAGLIQLNRLPPGAYGFTGSPWLETPPSAGPYRGRADTVRVGVRAAHRPLLFSALVGPIAVEARATAGVRPTERPGEFRTVLIE